MRSIRSKEEMEEAAVRNGVLPFFPCCVPGLSIAEMTPPSLLFGGNEGYDGCWEWKGPVIRRKTTAYGKFFKRKAGFVALDLLPHFLNWRRSCYPVRPGSTEQMLLDILSVNDGLTSTDLRSLILGTPAQRRRGPADLVDITGTSPAADSSTDDLPPFISRSDTGVKSSAMASVHQEPDGTSATSHKSGRHSLEGPLQRLQMGGHLLISDFTYKQTRTGERYGWGVARYATPESLLGITAASCTAAQSHDVLLDRLSSLHPDVPRPLLAILLK